jgi:hypothetical protein
MANSSIRAFKEEMFLIVQRITITSIRRASKTIDNTGRYLRIALMFMCQAGSWSQDLDWMLSGSIFPSQQGHVK